MVMDGATIIDVGGESTRPGALEVDVEPTCGLRCRHSRYPI